MPSHSPGIIEDPRSKLQGVLDRKECGLFSGFARLPRQRAAGNGALAFAVHMKNGFTVDGGCLPKIRQ